MATINFLISGISQTVLVNLVSYHGGASPVKINQIMCNLNMNVKSVNTMNIQSTLLPVFTSYLAMAVVYFLPRDHHKTTSDHRQDDNNQSIESPNPHHSLSNIHHHHRRRNNKKNKENKYQFSINNIIDSNELKMMVLAFYDLVCGIISFLSLVWSGSAIFQLVYSSIIIVTATFRHFLLPNKKLSLQQWIACWIVTFGLLLSGFGQNNHSHSHSSSFTSNILAAFSQLLWPLITTTLYAIEYVLIEKLLQGKNAPSDNELCCKMGFYGLSAVCLYQIFNVIPNWNNTFIHEITIHNGSGAIIAISYFWIFISNFLHNWSYFKLLHNSGAVSTGINQALRAVGVFVISGIFFCELQESQCFNSFKFLSLIIVIIGVLRYAFITAMYQHNKNGELYIMSIDDQNKHLV